MADIPRRYPMSTADGQAVPLDILRPHSILSFEAVAGISSVAIQIPTNVEVFSVLSECDAILQFGVDSSVVASDLVSGVLKNQAIYIPQDMVIFLSPPIDVTYFAVIPRETGAGTVIIQYLESWNSLSTKPQHQRR